MKTVLWSNLLFVHFYFISALIFPDGLKAALKGKDLSTLIKDIAGTIA